MKQFKYSNRKKDRATQSLSFASDDGSHHYHRDGPNSSRYVSRDHENGHRSSAYSSYSSQESSSTDLSSPPRAFPKRSRIIETRENRTHHIRLRRTRWEPITVKEERQRLESVKQKNSKKEKKKKQKKGKSRKELVEDFNREKDHFRPLAEFVQNRKRLAEEMLDSMDLETRYEIFPELEGMSDNETHSIIFDSLKGMSRDRILTIMKGKYMSESSSTDIDVDNVLTDEEVELKKVYSTIDDESPSISNRVEEGKIKKARKQKLTRKVKKPPEMTRTRDDDLEEGELRSVNSEVLDEVIEETIEDVHSSSSDSEKSTNQSSGDDDDSKEKFNGLMENEEKKDGEEEEEMMRMKLLQQQRMNKQRKICQQQKSDHLQNSATDEHEPTIPKPLRLTDTDTSFIISIDWSPPKHSAEDDEVQVQPNKQMVQKQETKPRSTTSEQKVICILPPSPMQKDNSEENEEEKTVEVKLGEETTNDKSFGVQVEIDNNPIKEGDLDESQKDDNESLGVQVEIDNKKDEDAESRELSSPLPKEVKLVEKEIQENQTSPSNVDLSFANQPDEQVTIQIGNEEDNFEEPDIELVEE